MNGHRRQNVATRGRSGEELLANILSSTWRAPTADGRRLGSAWRRRREVLRCSTGWRPRARLLLRGRPEEGGSGRGSRLAVCRGDQGRRARGCTTELALGAGGRGGALAGAEDLRRAWARRRGWRPAGGRRGAKEPGGLTSCGRPPAAGNGAGRRDGGEELRLGRGGGACRRRLPERDRKSTRLNSSHITRSRMPSSA